MNPDCLNGKHRACAGDGWDDETDSPTACPCPCHTTTPAGRPAPTTDPKKVTGL